MNHKVTLADLDDLYEITLASSSGVDNNNRIKRKRLVAVVNPVSDKEPITYRVTIGKITEYISDVQEAVKAYNGEPRMVHVDVEYRRK